MIELVFFFIHSWKLTSISTYENNIAETALPSELSLYIQNSKKKRIWNEKIRIEKNERKKWIKIKILQSNLE